jgi:hypothetical protein
MKQELSYMLEETKTKIKKGLKKFVDIYMIVALVIFVGAMALFIFSKRITFKAVFDSLSLAIILGFVVSCYLYYKKHLAKIKPSKEKLHIPVVTKKDGTKEKVVEAELVGEEKNKKGTNLFIDSFKKTIDDITMKKKK